MSGTRRQLRPVTYRKLPFLSEEFGESPAAQELDNVTIYDSSALCQELHQRVARLIQRSARECRCRHRSDPRYCTKLQLPNDSGVFRDSFALSLTDEQGRLSPVAAGGAAEVLDDSSVIDMTIYDFIVQCQDQYRWCAISDTALVMRLPHQGRVKPESVQNIWRSENRSGRRTLGRDWQTR